MTVPLLPPHVAGVEEELAVIAGGWVMLNVLVIEHPFASVIVQVYVPTHLDDAVGPDPPLGAQE